MRRSLWLIVSASLLSCAQKSPSEQSVAPLAAVPSSLTRPEVRARLAVFTPSVRPLLTAPLQVELPVRAGNAAKLSRADGAQIEVRALDVDGVASPTEGGRLVERAARSTDVVFLSGADVFEEVRVLHDAAGPTRARYVLRGGPGVAGFRVRRGVVEAHASNGEVLFATTFPFAIDANGVERPLRLSLSQDHGDTVMTTELDPVGLAYPIVVDPVWTATGTMTCAGFVSGRAFATTVGTERVAVVGGSEGRSGEGCRQSTSSYPDKPEFWNSATNTWAVPPTWISQIAAATMLGDKLLVAGGTPTNTAAQLFDMATGVATATTSLPAGRSGAVAATLQDGRALLVGGSLGSTYYASALLYSGGAWSAAGSMATARSGANAVALGNRALVFGGFPASGPRLTSAELWDAGAFTSAGSPSTTHTPRLVALSPTQALAIGGDPIGSATAPTGSVQMYTVGSGWTARAPMPTPRDARAALTAGGRVAVVGGLRWMPSPYSETALSTVEIYDPARDAWLPASPLSVPRASGPVVGLAGGRVLAVGGRTATTGSIADYTDTSEVFTPQPLGTTCAFAGDCASGACEGSVCCDTVGCTGTRTCSAPGKAGTCVKVNGQSCAGGTECASGICTDGVCCNAACGGQCEACNVAGSVGTCGAVSGAPLGGRSACAGAVGGDPCSAKHCDGSNRTACTFMPATTKCSANACTTGTGGSFETKESLCSGAGACTDAPKSCGAYGCAATTCKTTCTANTDCAAGYVCESGACKKAPDLGKSCSGSSGCLAPLSCVDGFCCASASCSTGTTCGYPGSEGTCVGSNGSACDASTMGADCGSGFCVDGVCCDTACNGQCQACDVPDPTTSRKGKCIPIKGAPHGTRMACSFDPSNACSEASCDGSDTTSCKGFVGSGTPCRAASCKDGVYTAPQTCDGAGACPASSGNTCDGYACTAEGTACKTRCATNDDCLNGFLCKDEKCTKKTASCSEDRLISRGEAAEQACTPYFCEPSGNCGNSCSGSEQCQPGFVCEVATKLCVTAPSASTDEGGGCAIGQSSAKSSCVAVIIAALGVSLARRRRKPLGDAD